MCSVLTSLLAKLVDTTIADQSLRPDDGRVHFQVFLGTSRFGYINAHHKQYILVDTIFNYMFHVGLPGTCLYLSQKQCIELLISQFQLRGYG